MDGEWTDDRGGGQSLAPGTILGRYEIVRLLGQGGMGSVYEAIHRDLKKRVAIKTLLPALAVQPEAKQRFLREGEAASRIRHPHVVDITDVVAEGPMSYLVMEYLEGEDLSKRLSRQGYIGVAQTVDVMLPVAAAIAAAHEQGVIHRDLKPENIFLARSLYGGVHPKVFDFGISKVLNDGRSMALTGTAATFGTTYYLPPEQLRGARQADGKSDQYALGTILYECVTGHRAFEGDNLYAILRAIGDGEFPPPRAYRADLPPEMEAIILRAMSLDPAHRFDSVIHLGAALLPFASPAARATWTPLFTGGDPVDIGTGYAAEAGEPAPGGGRAPSGGFGSSRPPSGRVRPPSGGLGAPLSGGASTGDVGRTMVLPQDVPAVAGGRTPTGGSRATPTPMPRRRSAAPSSSTLRDATGEASAYRAAGRSRAPMVLGVSAAALAVGVILILTVFHPGRGPRGGGDDKGASQDPSSDPSSASLPPRPPPGQAAFPSNPPPLPAVEPPPQPGPSAVAPPSQPVPGLGALPATGGASPTGDEPGTSGAGTADAAGGDKGKKLKPGRHHPHGAGAAPRGGQPAAGPKTPPPSGGAPSPNNAPIIE